jgi:molybdate transport system regulatory protein
MYRPLPDGSGAVTDTRLTLRIDFGARRSVGPGKVRLLEAVGSTGSISKAGRSLGMSYRRAWLLIDDMNRCFRHAVVHAKPGGSRGGGAVLTRFGSDLIRDYRAIERAAVKSAKSRLRGLEAALGKPPKTGGTGPRRISVRGARQ